MLWIIFSYCDFHNASKEYFWSKKIQISCTGSKVPFWQFGNFSKKVQKGYFLKKPSRELKKNVLGSYESLEGLER